MQTRSDLPSLVTPNLLEEAYARARAALNFDDAAAVASESTASTDAPQDDSWPERLLIGHELLLAVREPVEWLLALARRLASGDPDDVAAIDRLTAAFHSRLACGGLGVRVADALTAFGILIGSLDPSIVVESATQAVADGVHTLLALDAATLAAQIARIAKPSDHRTCAARPRGARRSRTHQAR